METLADLIESLLAEANKASESTTRLIDLAKRLRENNCIDAKDYMRRINQIAYQTGYAEGITYAIGLLIKAYGEEKDTND